LRIRPVVGAILVAVATGVFAAVPPEKIFDMTIGGGVLPAEQRVIKVARGDTVRLRVMTDAPGELHLHGYRLELKPAPGRPAETVFKAHATGRYPFEWHGAGDKAKGSRHHGPEFAVLEVHPK
jgi:FtsP/CotA-like multicopper oxidase with cupredoxin domain